jgi:hypothetical protein
MPLVQHCHHLAKPPDPPTVQIGDTVTWLLVDDRGKTIIVTRFTGVLRAVVTEGELRAPMTSASLPAKRNDPACMVQVLERNEAGEDGLVEIEQWHLLYQSALTVRVSRETQQQP